MVGHRPPPPERRPPPPEQEELLLYRLLTQQSSRSGPRRWRFQFPVRAFLILALLIAITYPIWRFHLPHLASRVVLQCQEDLRTFPDWPLVPTIYFLTLAPACLLALGIATWVRRLPATRAFVVFLITLCTLPMGGLCAFCLTPRLLRGAVMRAATFWDFAIVLVQILSILLCLVVGFAYSIARAEHGDCA